MFRSIIAMCLMGAATLPAATEEVQPAAPQVSVGAESELPEVFQLWRDVFDAGIESLKTSGFLEDDDTTSVPLAREACDKALAAAEKLRKAQMEYAEACFQVFDDHCPTEKRMEWMRTRFTEVVDECFSMDLQYLAAYNMWMDEAPRALAGASAWENPREDRITPPVFEGQPAHGTIGVEMLMAARAEVADKLLGIYVQQLENLYAKGGILEVEPLTALDDSDENPISVADMARLGTYFKKAEAAWKEYCEVMQEVICPASAFHGTGEGELMMTLMEGLREEHLRYLIMLTSGLPEPGADCADEELEIAESCDRAYGEVFETESTLLVHPTLAGAPWCVILDSEPEVRSGECYLVATDAKLDSFSAAFPDGARVRARGYMEARISGKPYELKETEDGELVPAVEDPYKVSPVFRLLSWEPIPEESDADDDTADEDAAEE